MGNKQTVTLEPKTTPKGLNIMLKIINLTKVVKLLGDRPYVGEISGMKLQV